MHVWKLQNRNASECYCCRQIEKCVEFVEDLDSQRAVDKEVICITDHPGFPAVCLNRWSLELAAENFKTRDAHHYSQINTKERYSKFSVFAYKPLEIFMFCQQTNSGIARSQRALCLPVKCKQETGIYSH